MSDQKDLYGVLGVSRSATKEDLKKAYRKKAIQYHPDKNKGDSKAEERFKEVSEAYMILSDDQKRRVYDQYGMEGVKGTTSSSGRGGFPDFPRNDLIFEHF